jgi:hypothetical protein
VKPIADSGKILEAEFRVEEVEGQTTLVLESRSGDNRNADYHKALLLLLERLAEMGATLINGIVDSAVSRTRPFSERILHIEGRPYPIALGEVKDMEALRIAIGAAQVSVAQQSGAKGGNRTKRIRLYLESMDAAGLEMRLATGGEESDEVRDARGKLGDIASPRRGRRQGRGMSAEKRRAVELRAMFVVESLLQADGWTASDVATEFRGYDIHAKRGVEERHIEVKGTTGYGDSVLLTRGEVRHAEEHHSLTVLAVVREIQLVQSAGSWIGVGGKCRMFNPWRLGAGVLEPIGFEWMTPPRPPN